MTAAARRVERGHGERHVGFGPSLVDEDQAGRIKPPSIPFPWCPSQGESIGDSQISRVLLQDAGWVWGKYAMGRAYSLDLREQVVLRAAD